MSSTSVLFRTVQRHQNLLITISLVLVALPFVALSFYNHPALDDIIDATIVREAGFRAAQKYFYLAHTGRYTTTVLLAVVNPLVYAHLEAHWWPVTLSFILGTLLLLRLGLGTLCGLAGGAAWRGAGLLTGLWLAYAPGQAEGLYWFTGAYTYLMTAWLLLLWLVVFACEAAGQQAGRHGWGWRAALGGLTLAVAGTTEPIALAFLVALLTGAALSWWYRRSRTLLLLAGLALVGSAISFGAPGNFVRMGRMGESFGVIKTLLYSAGTTAYLLLTWVGNPVLLALSALLLPALRRVARQRELLLVQLLSYVPAGVMALFLSLLLTAASCPAYYASGTGLPPRVRNTLYLLFVVGWFGVLLAWCCRQARSAQPSRVLEVLVARPLRPLWAGLLLLFFLADYNVQTRRHLLGNGSNNVVRAYQQWLGGDAARYDAELRARYQLLAAGTPVTRLPPLQSQPELLFSFDIVGVTDPDMLRTYGSYFGVPAIPVATPH